ncbi:MAG: hypothetical protein PHU44_03875 [Syntrophales bacterium]|nr:hypothetical protein [Syntrophales bacterium]MDD5640580.1 hypothetical protein [Syntrophales bacterium]
MEVPKTKEEMEQAQYSLTHVSKIFPDIKPNTLQVWIKREVIKPAIQSAGQGYPTRLSYLNLMEVGLVNLLVNRGVNSHKWLRALLNSGKNYSSKTPLVELMREFKFSRFLLLPGGMRVWVQEGEEVNQDDPHPVYQHRSFEDLKGLMDTMGIPDWLVVNVELLKKYVDGKLREL